DSIIGDYTFFSLNTNGNPLSLPKLDSIIGDYTFQRTTTGAIDLSSLTEITGSDTFSSLKSSTLTLRTNLKISKPSGIDNFYYCCNSFVGDTFLNLLYSTIDGIPGGTAMTGITLTLPEEPTLPEGAVAGKWRMNANGSNFVINLRTITLKPAVGMTLPNSFTVTGAPWKTPLALTDTTPNSNGVYTWTKPST
ncbi:MAG: hypothetical protein LBI26_01650, partial [Holosporales bacterium]|nr:hypothetical protein [Holosporales bacterium]